MAKVLVLGLALALALATTAASAQSDNGPDHTAQGRSVVRSGNITSTGETVPNPGASQSAGTTPLDRGIQSEDTKIQNSICKGC